MSKFLDERYSSLAAYVPGEQPQDKKYIKLNDIFVWRALYINFISKQACFFSESYSRDTCVASTLWIEW